MGVFGKGKGSVRSESLLVSPVPWHGDGGRRDGEEGSPPETRVQGANLPKSDEGDEENERQNEDICNG